MKSMNKERAQTFRLAGLNVHIFLIFLALLVIIGFNHRSVGAAGSPLGQSNEQLFPLFFIPWPPSAEATEMKDHIWIPVMVSLESFQDALNGLETSDASGAVKPLESGQKLIPETKLNWKGAKALTLKLPNVADFTLNPLTKIEWLLVGAYPGIKAIQGSVGLQHKKSGQTLNLKGPGAKPVQIGDAGFNMSKPQAPAPEPVKSEPEEQAISETKEQSEPEESPIDEMLIKEVKPVYPEIARQAREEGVVILEITIDTRGNVISTKTLYGKPLLEEAAVKAVKQWKFKPYFLNGAPVPFQATVTVRFSLH